MDDGGCGKSRGGLLFSLTCSDPEPESWPGVARRTIGGLMGLGADTVDGMGTICVPKNVRKDPSGLGFTVLLNSPFRSRAAFAT
jgi:hypothetical protein